LAAGSYKRRSWPDRSPFAKNRKDFPMDRGAMEEEDEGHGDGEDRVRDLSSTDHHPCGSVARPAEREERRRRTCWGPGES